MRSNLKRSASKTTLASRDSKDYLDNLHDTRKAVESAESRARISQRKTGKSNDRQFAEALHREADQLYQNGDYESALVLYHRAANVCPRDNSHTIAARRTVTTINSCNNPTRRLKRVLSKTKGETDVTVALCPEAAAAKGADLLREAPQSSSVAEALRYLEHHKSLWNKMPVVPSESKARLGRSNALLTQLNNAANLSLKKLEASFRAGNTKIALKRAKELLTIASGLAEPFPYQTAAHHYLALIRVSVGRHDKAVNSVARMVYSSKKSGDPILIARSLITLGKVHLTFGHLEAAARAWQHLSAELEQPILRAWIYHEIGRCHLETGKYRKALDMAARCLEFAEEASSKKWIFHGKLLRGQTLIKLGRFGEALVELRISAKITEEEGDTPTLSYIQHLIAKLTETLRKIAFGDEAAVGRFEGIAAATSPPRQRNHHPEKNTLICDRSNNTDESTIKLNKRIAEEWAQRDELDDSKVKDAMSERGDRSCGASSSSSSMDGESREAEGAAAGTREGERERVEEGAEEGTGAGEKQEGEGGEGEGKGKEEEGGGQLLRDSTTYRAEAAKKEEFVSLVSTWSTTSMDDREAEGEEEEQQQQQEEAEEAGEAEEAEEEEEEEQEGLVKRMDSVASIASEKSSSTYVIADTSQDVDGATESAKREEKKSDREVDDEGMLERIRRVDEEGAEELIGIIQSILSMSDVQVRSVESLVDAKEILETSVESVDRR